MNSLTALKWIHDQSGLTITMGANKQATLTYGHIYEITGKNIPDAVTKLHIAIKAKRLIKPDNKFEL